MPYKDIARIIPAVQAAKLAEINVKKSKKKSTVKEMVELGTTNIVGTSLIKVNADLIEGL